jgi:hypothetical protein
MRRNSREDWGLELYGGWYEDGGSWIEISHVRPGIKVKGAKKTCNILIELITLYFGAAFPAAVLRIRIRSDPDLFWQIPIRIRTSGTRSGFRKSWP